MSSVLVALMVLVFLLFGLGAVLLLAKVMRAELAKTRAATAGKR
jgi:hypothetical protein